MATSGIATGGSRKWLQLLVNDHPEIIREQLGEAIRLNAADIIEWCSPLRADDYREYQDAGFLRNLNLELPDRSLRDFWPAKGPVWDALATTTRGDVILVEAKAHIPEMKTPSSQAENEASVALIRQSLEETRLHVRGSDYVDWSEVFYQYTNRLAHLYLLRELNRVPAWLVFVYFVGDADMGGPGSVDEWKGAIDLLHTILGLRHGYPLSNSVIDVFVDISDLRT